MSFANEQLSDSDSLAWGLELRKARCGRKLRVTREVELVVMPLG